MANPTTNDWASKCVKFGETLLAAKNTYAADLEKVNGHFVYLSSNNARSYIQTPSIVSVSGGINMWLGAIAGFLVGFAASSLICTFVGIWKEDKEEEKAAKASEAK